MGVRRLFRPRCLLTLTVVFDAPREVLNDALRFIPGAADVFGRTPERTYKVIPRRAEVRRNNARTADEAMIELDYSNMPLDPRGISAIHVNVHMGDGDFEPGPENTLFHGLVDVPTARLQAGGDTIRMECRDYTGIYLAADWRRLGFVTKTEEGQSSARLPLRKGETLGAFVRRAALEVTPNASEVQFLEPDVANLPIAQRIGKTLIPVKKKDSVWDVLTYVCDQFAMVPVWEIDPVIGAILRVRSASTKGVRKAVMEYGSNLEKLEFSRKLTKPEDKAVHVVCWDALAGVAREAVHPDVGKAGGETLEEKGTKRNTQDLPKRVTYHLEGGLTQSQLKRIAERMYKEIRSERLQGEIVTRDLVDLLDENLLGLANGDQLIVQIGRQFEQTLYGMEPGEAIAWLSNPFRPNHLPLGMAQAAVDAIHRARAYSARFYVLEAHHTWDVEDGYRLSARFRDYLLRA